MNALDYSDALEKLLQDRPRAESAGPRAKQAPAVAPGRSISIREVEAQLALCNKILGSPVFAHAPALVLALQDGHTDMLATWMNGVLARLDGTEAGNALARFAGDHGEAIALLALGMLAGFERGASSLTGYFGNIRKAVSDAKLA
jgi:hypothetical protein